MTSHRSFISASATALALGSMAQHSQLAQADGGTVDPATLAPAAPVPASVLTTTFPSLDGEQSFDCALIPADLRLAFLKDHVRAYIANRLNSVHTRHSKDPLVVAWASFKAASEADPLQTIVAKPDKDEPAAPDFAEAFTRAVDDLTKGNVRKQSDEPKKRVTKDPLTAVVTDAVVREVYDAERAKDNKFTFIMARAKVGTDGIKYLNALIDAKVAEGADRTALGKMLEARYVGPAKLMLGLSTPKATAALPSIL